MRKQVHKWTAELIAGWWKKLITLGVSAIPLALEELPGKLFEHWYLSLIVDSLKEHVRLMEIAQWLLNNLWVLPIIVICGILLHAYLRSLHEPAAPPEPAASPEAEPAPPPAISAKYVRKNIIPRHPFEGMAAKINRDAGGRSPAASFDLLLEVHVVNTTAHARTIQKIEAEALLEDKWVRLKEADLALYQLAHEDSRFAKGGMRNVMAKMERLESLKQKLRDTPLLYGVGVQGWLAFEIWAENDQLEEKQTQFRVWLVDSLEGKNPVVTIDELNREGRITYVPTNG